MRKIFMIFLIANCSCLSTQAQNVATVSLRWTSDQTTDLRSNTTRNYSCTFITQGSQGVSWLQRNGQIITEYTVTGTEGAWSDVSLEGSYTYLLSLDGKTGRLNIVRAGGTLTFTLDFSESGEFSIKQMFRVTEVAVEP